MHKLIRLLPFTAVTSIAAALLVSAMPAQDPVQGPPSKADRGSLRQPNPVSPVRGIRRSPQGSGRQEAHGSREVRSYDGYGNNPHRPKTGMAGTQLVRLASSKYSDGISSPAGEDRNDARTVSNLICEQTAPMPNGHGLTDYLWQWGQFLDHDIDLTGGIDPPEAFDIPVPAGDPWFDPANTGTQTMALNRSIYDPLTGLFPGNPRQQLNEITAWIDASNVYGSSEARALALRTLDGTGRMLTSAGDLLPFNTAGLPNAGGPSPDLFLAGDVRANEQTGLAAMHTLFVREHNWLAGKLRLRFPSWSGERIYQKARQLVGAEMQAITYREFLPALFGGFVLPPYQGYDPAINAGIRNVFSTSAYRFGHTLLPSHILRVDATGTEIADGHLALRDAFFNPSRITDEGSIDPILRGLSGQLCQTVDPFLIDDVRNFLFGPPGSGGFDLAALNIQRGRDHGIPSYNKVRNTYGLQRARNFADVCVDVDLQVKLNSAYPQGVSQMDAWVGGLSEDRLPGSMVGPLLQAVLTEQFQALRDGDRFWYERFLKPAEIAFVEQSTLATIIRRNTSIGSELADDVFHMP